MNILSEIFYAPGGMMSAKHLYNKAITVNPSITMRDVNEWYRAQPLVQINNRSNLNKYAQHGHFLVTQPNFMHQADILYMPTDKSGYKYALCVVDAATRYKAAQPIKTKTSSEVAKALNYIYNNTLLVMPKKFLCDNGSEFKGDVKKYLGDIIIYGVPGNHKSQAIVERFNRTLAERLFRQMHQKEMDTNKVVNNWVDLLQPTIDSLNSEVTRMINMSPNEAMKLDRVEQKIKYMIDAPPLSIGDTVRYKLAPDQIHNISNSEFKDGEVTKLVTDYERRRATDPIYSLTKHVIESKLVKPGLPTLYYISGHRHGYTGSNLIKVT